MRNEQLTERVNMGMLLDNNGHLNLSSSLRLAYFVYWPGIHRYGSGKVLPAACGVYAYLYLQYPII